MAEQGRIIPKQQIEIIKYESEIPYGQGGKTLDRIIGKNLSLAEGDPLVGKTLRLTIFNADLKEYLAGKPEAFRFLADIEERNRPDSQYGPDRTIVQVYNQAEPVSKKKAAGGGGGGYRGRSLEEDIALENVKRRSIEGQTAVAQVGEWLRNPNAMTNTLTKEQCDRIVAKYWKAVEMGLDNYLAIPAAAPKRSAAPNVGNAAERPQGGQDGPAKTEPVKKPVQPPADPVKNFGDLLTRANKKGLSPRDVATILHVTEVKDITDLNKAWSDIEKHLAKSEEVTEASFK
jgi:hypothetical protein